MPARARLLEQHVGAVDVGLDEVAGLLDRAVDVGLGGEVDDRVAALDRARATTSGSAMSPSTKLEPAAVDRGPGAFSTPPGVGELVEHDDAASSGCSASMWRTKFEPMKPAPPVTSSFTRAASCARSAR